jgi:hypothetical protein
MFSLLSFNVCARKKYKIYGVFREIARLFNGLTTV